jgi:hypothetical protein
VAPLAPTAPYPVANNPRASAPVNISLFITGLLRG